VARLPPSGQGRTASVTAATRAVSTAPRFTKSSISNGSNEISCLYGRYPAHIFKFSPFALAHGHDEVPLFPADVSGRWAPGLCSDETGQYASWLGRSPSRADDLSCHLR